MTPRGASNAKGNGADAEVARRCLEKILASPHFVHSARLREFLRFVVEETLQGRGGDIKEAVVAGQVFGRGTDFDGHSDSVVRVQATHLRQRLREYYRTEGVPDPLVIEIPPGSYVPVLRASSVEGAASMRPRVTRQLVWWGAAALVAGVAGIWLILSMGSGLPPAVAVLEFANLDGTASNGVVSEGIAEDLTTALAQSPGLRVVAQTSAMQVRGKNLSTQTIGRELGAGLLVEGSVRGTGGQLKMTARVVKAGTGIDLWSESWEGETNEAPLFEDQIVRAVRKTLGMAPGSGQREPAAVRLPSVEAEEPYLQGRVLLARSLEDIPLSIPVLEKATRADPLFAPAHAALATAYVMGLYHGVLSSREEGLRMARQEGARAIELDPNSSEAWATLAMVSSVFDHDWPAAQRGFRKALELNPSDARAHLQFGMGLLTRARFSEALAHLEQARALDPLSFAATNYVSVGLYCAGHYDESIAAARSALSSNPDFAAAHVAIGRGLALKGDYAGALSEFARAIQKYGRSPFILGRMGFTLARAGRTKEALDLIPEIERQHGPAIQAAFIYAGLGDKRQALDALDRALADGNIDLNFMAVDPMLASLRSEPRFMALRQRIGL